MDHLAPCLPCPTPESFSLDAFPIVTDDALFFCLKAQGHSELELDLACREFMEMRKIVGDFLTLLRQIDKKFKSQECPPESLQFARFHLLAVGHGLVLCLKRTRFGPLFPKTRRRLSRQIRYALAKAEPPKPSRKPSSKPTAEPSKKSSKSQTSGFQSLEDFIREGGMTLKKSDPVQWNPLLSEATAIDDEKSPICVQKASQNSFFRQNPRMSYTDCRAELTNIRTFITQHEI